MKRQPGSLATSTIPRGSATKTISRAARQAASTSSNSVLTTTTPAPSPMRRES